MKRGQTGVNGHFDTADFAAASSKLTRRSALMAGAAGVGAVGFGGAGRWLLPAAAQKAETALPQDVCVLTPEMTEGPFYLPLDLVRQDITEGTPGVPLRLRIAVQDVASCARLADAAVDIWHCDAQGYYSGVSGEPGGNASMEAGAGAESGTFLRGIQLTDADGVAEFMTIYPGWYAGRAVHIHMMVHVGGTAGVIKEATPAADDGTYEGGRIAHIGQLFFDDAVSDAVYADAEAYAGRDDARRVRNDQDGILGGSADEPGFVLSLEPVDEGANDAGFVGTITIGVDPAAVLD